MRHHNSLFHHLLQFVPWGRFEALVDRHGADVRVRRLSAKSQFVALLHAQLSGASSLREIETTLSSHRHRLYHLGARVPARSTLADANAKRPADLYADLFTATLATAHRGLRRASRDAVHLIDASSIRLANACRGWADYEAHGALVKLHLDYDPITGIPAHFEITPARVNDITQARALSIEPGATYVFDLGYYDFSWWSVLHNSGCRFVTRLKTHTRPRLIEERSIEAGGPVRADRTVAIDTRLKSVRGARHPLAGIPLREVVVIIETGKTLRLLTNDLNAPAAEIADLYKMRWRIELFFRWIKQHLKIKRFIGTSENAIRTQIAIALIAFLLLRIAHHTQKVPISLLTFARLVRTNLMHRRPLHDLDKPPPPVPSDPRQQVLALC